MKDITDIFSSFFFYNNNTTTESHPKTLFYFLYTIISLVLMFVSVVWILYYFFPQVRVSGFRQLIQHYILRTPETERGIQVWLQDKQFVDTFGELYRLINKGENNNERRQQQSSSDKKKKITHYCFLVHGVNGYSQDLSYPETVLKLFIDWKKLQLEEQEVEQDMIVHCVTCNEKKTSDGVENGGKRLLDEIMTTLIQNNDNNSELITISMFGNSLGGLYSRYAAGELYSLLTNSSKNTKYTKFFNSNRIEFNVFLTTATPHLGLSKNTYWPMPRAAEIGIAHTLGETGKDLFQLNDLLKRMTTEPKYYNSLQAFRKRIVYANAYRTDFPVPTATAAFLHERSSYPHYYDDDNTTTDTTKIWKKNDENNLIIATLHTRPSSSFRNSTEEEKKVNTTNEDDDSINTSTSNERLDEDLLLMSNSLDSLGWKKVFVDLRAEIPIGVKLPSPVLQIRKRLLENKNKSDNSPSKLKDTSTSTTSREVALATKENDSNRIIYPLGHNMLVAVSRCEKSASFNSGGRPLIHDLAHDLVELVFNHDYSSSSSTTDGNNNEQKKKNQ